MAARPDGPEISPSDDPPNFEAVPGIDVVDGELVPRSGSISPRIAR